jgi:Recombination, repair and ssDNA binding protein UvsY
MEVDEIIAMWNAEAEIDPLNLTYEIKNIGRMHVKYWQIFIEEKKVLTRLLQKQKKRKVDIYNMYTVGATAEDKKRRGIEHIPQKTIIKGEASMYVEADEEMIRLAMAINDQEDKVDLLKSIIRMVDNRNFQISNHLKERQYKDGSNY